MSFVGVGDRPRYDVSEAVRDGQPTKFRCSSRRLFGRGKFRSCRSSRTAFYAFCVEVPGEGQSEPRKGALLPLPFFRSLIQ